jgi:hypothetical protein
VIFRAWAALLSVGYGPGDGLALEKSDTILLFLTFPSPYDVIF